jgi:predicted transcriptional regulator of viral defense system
LGAAIPDIQAVLGRLHGVATRSELAAAGVTETQLRRQLRKGALLPVRRGAYVLPELVAAAAGDPAREHALAAAAAIRLAGSRSRSRSSSSAGPGSSAGPPSSTAGVSSTAGTGTRAAAGIAASHQSAAIIHGLDLLTQPDHAVLTLTRNPHGSRSRSDRAAAIVHIADLPPDQVTVQHGVPVTTIARTIVDLARTLPLTDGVVLADVALHARQASRSELAAVLATCTRWPGARRAERVTAFSDPRAESALESVARLAFDELGLPPPKLQAWVGDDDRVIGRVDFLWSEYRTIGEADGAIKYLEPQRAIGQLGRDAWLREAGFEVVHFSWQQISKVPWQVAASLRAAFERGAAAPA